MNRIYKVIWSNAKGRYVVVSELVSRYAHSTAVSGQHKTMLAALVACLCIGGTALATPATNPAGEGPGVAIGTGSNASRDTSIAIGKDAHMRMHGGIPSTAEGEIAIGNNSLIENYLNQGGSIVFGQKAHVQNMFGSTERSMLMGQTVLNGGLPAAPSNLAGGIAIGENSYARSGSLMVGTHNYRGDIGDTIIDTGAADTAAGSMHNANLQMNSTTLGTNSFNFGAFSTVTGAYTAVTGDYTKDKWANFGATVTGSLNTIESKSSTGANAGVANSILGTANRTANTNGSVVLGAGNAISNSVDTLSFTPDQSMSSAKVVADKFREAIKNSNGGGALTVLGSGNTADYVQASQIIGVNNTLKGTSGAVSKYNFINGYKNDVHHVTHATVIGSENTVGGTAGDMLEDIVVIGNNRRATSRSDHSIILGSSDVSGDTYNVAPNMVVIGRNANVRDHGGNQSGGGDVAVGNGTLIENYVNQGGSVALGQKAHVRNMTGSTEVALGMGQVSWTADANGTSVPDDPSKVAGGVAIGENAFARTGSLMIGTHNYRGAIGDTMIDTGAADTAAGSIYNANLQMNSTTLGTNSFNFGAFSTVTGAYTAVTGDYTKDKWANFGATVTGSLNTIESKSSTGANAGVANSILGTANRTANTNGTVVLGAGNEITNSFDTLSFMPDKSMGSAKDVADKFREAIKNSNGGGATLAIGGGNTADWTQLSQIIGVNNTLKGTSGAISKFNMIDGYKNTVTKAEHVSVIGSENTVENSKSQTVIGDSNKITDRNAGTVSGKQEERTKNVSDLVIGKGNKIEGNSTYMKGYESLTVIGNNNEMVNPGAGIVIGDNQKVGAIKESVVIGSMTPEEKADSDIQQKHASVVVGYHAQSGTRDGGGMNVALGHGAKAYGWQETVTGIKSIVEAGDSGLDGYLASVYGGLNTVASNKADQDDGMANTVVGTLNKTEGANGALVFGAGNSVTHSFGTAPTDENGNSMNEYWGDTISFHGQEYAGGTGQLSHDELRKAMGLAMSTGGGSVVTMGNGNTSDYAVHSQIIGSGNILTGTANTPSINNTINGYGNTGRNVERMSMMGTGNNMSGSTADVVIGDYHHMDGGKNNVILGSMATEKKTVEKTYTRKDASGNVILEKKYKVMENVPIKSHTANISNAVMLGYNTDVEKDGGVALGADSIASVDKGVEGYDPAAGNHANDTTGTWKATAAAVSVGKAADPTGAAGSPAITRQITNVAAGTQDTDAVNVAQLKAVQTAADASKVHYYSVNDKGYHVGNYNNDGAKGGMALAAGAGAAANGTASTVTGAFSRVDGDGVNGFTNGFQGATSSVYGTFNVVGAKNGVKFDGVANSIVGVANKTENANAALIFGAGNKVTNSYRPVDMASAAPLANALQTAIQQGNTDEMIEALGALVKDSGGAVLAIGGANTADYAQLSKLVGVGNKLTGTENKPSAYNMIDGYLNTGKNINYVTVIGSENEVEDTDDALVLGNKRKVSDAGGSIILGSGDRTITTNVSDAVSIGHNANVTEAGGVALGSRSVASTDRGVAGYDPSTKAASTDTSSTWQATDAAVSVGNASGHVTRQITSVAAGTQDTDAVNVAQLKKAVAGAADGNDTLVSGSNGLSLSGKTLSMSVKDTAGNEVKGSVDLSSVADGNDKLVSDNNALSLSGKTLSMSVKDTAGNEVKGSVDLSAIAGQIDTNTTYTMSGTQNADNTTTITLKGSDGKENKVTVATKDTRNTVKAGENVSLDTAANTFGGTEYTVNVKADGKVENGSTKIVSGNTVYHETRVKNDGNYVKKENSAGDNLTILDKQVGKNTTNITNLGNTINNLDNRISKVGAGAAALAALHPLDFDPDDKWDIAAGYGNYKDAHAVSVGAFYRPNEDTMFSVGGSFGGGENMVNAGVSVKLGQGNHVSTSKVAMAKEIVDLKADNKELRKQIEDMNDRLNAVLGLLDTSKTKDFPDVPENHWAYEYIRVLAGNGLIQGYPDGTFGGDRSMTRYEFATLLYRALKNGAPVDDTMDKAMNEFEPELRRIRADRIRVDRIFGKDNDRSKVERVRVNNDDDKENNDYRDVYGSHIPAEG